MVQFEVTHRVQSERSRDDIESSRINSQPIGQSLPYPFFTMNEIMTAAEVAAYFRTSLSSLKRWVMLSRRGTFDFPIPISPKRSQLRWRREDIMSWNSNMDNVPVQSTVEVKTNR